MSLPSQRQLPIYEIQGAILDAVRESRRAIVRAPTGSGKSTQVPQMLLDAGLAGAGQIVVLEPRRLAARMLAARVAAERGGPLGAEVGYQVRFDNRTGPRTRIRYVTDGVLIRQLVGDPALGGVSVLVFDEFHERHLYTDVMLGQALLLQRSRRPDLVLVVMSATLEAVDLRAYLEPCRLVESEGRAFPVEVEYLDRADDRTPVWELAAREFERAGAAGSGHALVFMPGAYEIRRTLEALARTAPGKGCLLAPLHGELPPAEQDAAVAPCPGRKVVVATNVAETSVTIDGVTLVIDSGLARKARFDPHRGINTLLIEKISRAAAEQRAGRAGRTAPGRCVRLWTERDHRARQAHELPEIQRVDLAEILLLLKACGTADFGQFPWLDAPPAKTLAQASSLLEDLGAIDAGSGAITPLGRRLLAFPVHPRFARMLVAAADYGCVATAACIAALTQERSLLLRRQGQLVGQRREQTLGEETESDLLLLLKAWRHAQARGYDLEACSSLGIHAVTARQVGLIQRQFLKLAGEERLDLAERDASSAAVRKCILAGFSDQLARSLGRGTTRYELVHRRRGTLDKESVVRDAPLIVAAEVQEIGRAPGEAEVRLSLATAVQTEWLEELFPHHLRRERAVFFDAETRRVCAEDRLLFRDLLLERKAAGEPDAEQAAAALALEVAAGRLTLKQWDHGVEQWILRLNSLAGWCPELGLPPLSAEDIRTLIEQICHGAAGYKEIKDRPVWPTVRAWLSPERQALLERHAPERLSLSNGRTPRLTYAEGQAPFVAVRIQELYDVRELPAIAMGRVRPLVHILAPNQRPVQITDDLASFWKNHYPTVKRELQRRYPKHEWR